MRGKNTVNQPSRSDQEYILVNGVKKRNLAYIPRHKQTMTESMNANSVLVDFAPATKNESYFDEEYDNTVMDIYDHNFYSDWITFRTPDGEKYREPEDLAYDMLYTHDFTDGKYRKFEIEVEIPLTDDPIKDEINRNVIFGGVFDKSDGVVIDRNKGIINATFASMDDLKNNEDIQLALELGDRVNEDNEAL